MDTDSLDNGLSGADSSLVRRWNRRAVLSALRAHPRITLSTMAKKTGLSRQTATTVLGELLERGIVEEHAPVSGSSGRPARSFSFRAGAGFAVGLSFAPDHIIAVATDLDGKVMARERATTPLDLPAPERLRLARGLAGATAERAGPVWTIGAATSGVVDRQGRISRATQIPGWTGLDLAGTVGAWFDCAGVAGNDAALAALGEQWCGVASYASDVALILTGHRGGQGMLLGGRVHFGRSGAAGELGKLLRDQAWMASSVLEETGRTAEQIFRAAHEGDPESLALSEEIAERTAHGASVLVAVLDPELVVIAGDFTVGGDPFLHAVRRHLGTLCISVPDVALSSLGSDVVPLGAARLALDELEEKQFLLDA